jgi:Putative transposase DNA-binding domain
MGAKQERTSGTMKATKTIKQALSHKPQHAAWFAVTQMLFNQVAAFYFSVVQAHPAVLDLPTQEALTALERLTHTTARHPHPVMPLSDAVAAPLPAMFRRAAIHAALGSARSFSTQLDKWRGRKEKALAKGKKFSERPPLPPRSWNRSVTLYAGQWKGRTKNTILLKLWTGRSWAWIKCRISGRSLPDGWEPASAQLVRHGTQWWLHTPIEKSLAAPASIEHLGTLKPEKGKYSRRGNSKRAFWMKGRIFRYAKYKAWNAGIITSRVNPRNTSRHCARCHGLVVRYRQGQPAEGYTPGAPLVLCPACSMRGHADRNASLMIGQRLIARYGKASQEKPHTPLHAERGEKSPGVAVCQEATCKRRPSTNYARQADHNEHGTAHETDTGMAASVSSIPHQLRLFHE